MGYMLSNEREVMQTSSGMLWVVFSQGQILLHKAKNSRNNMKKLPLPLAS